MGTFAEGSLFRLMRNEHAYLREDTSCMLPAYYKKGGTGNSPRYKHCEDALPEVNGEPAVNVMKTGSPLPLFRE